LGVFHLIHTLILKAVYKHRERSIIEPIAAITTIMLNYKFFNPIILPTTEHDAFVFNQALGEVVDTLNRTRFKIAALELVMQHDISADVTSMAFEPTDEHPFRWTVMASGGYFFEFSVHPDDARDCEGHEPAAAAVPDHGAARAGGGVGDSVSDAAVSGGCLEGTGERFQTHLFAAAAERQAV
jgi:hypothetical protein